MARPKAKAPARSYHMSGQSIVRIDGKDFYLGKHDSPESIARYAVLIGIYQKHGLRLPADFDAALLDAQASILLGTMTPSCIPANQADQPVYVSHITALFRDHVAVKYKNAPQELARHNRLCDQLDAKFANVPAEKFGPLRLREFRDWLVGQKLSRKYINRLVNCVIAIFRHAVSLELIDSAKVHQLTTLESLQYGQTDAHEVDEVQPVDIGHVRLTSAHLSPIIKTILRVQIATGMRPKEIFSMRPCDIDRTGHVWLYNPATHKTKHKGKRRTIPIIGDAREAIIDYLARDPKSYLFSPAESMAWRRAVGAAKRKTPLNQGNRPGTNKKVNPARTPRNQYDAQSYRQAIQRAAKTAGVPQWHPYQLRHLTATVVRAALGIEDAQALLGHSTALMTAHYARESIEAATRAAKVAPKL